jgi:tetratricopeptide (TPR) repeat protein
MTHHMIWTRVALLATGALTVAACGSASAARWNSRGNDAFAKTEYADAQIAYEQAVAAQPARAQTLYNLGNTQFRQAAQEMAQTTLSEAAQAAQTNNGDILLAAEAFYNLGNSRFAAADYAGAVEAYKETLRRTPDDMDAKVNLELALRQMENEQTPTAEPSPTPEATPTPEENEEEPSPTPTPQTSEGTPTEDPATPSPEPTPSPEATATPEPNATTEGTATPAGTATPDGTPTNEAEATPNVQGTPTELPGSPTPDPATLPPGAMTDAQARQILEAATSDTQTLQQRLQQLLQPLDPTVEKDW